MLLDKRVEGVGHVGLLLHLEFRVHVHQRDGADLLDGDASATRFGVRGLVLVQGLDARGSLIPKQLGRLLGLPLLALPLAGFDVVDAGRELGYFPQLLDPFRCVGDEGVGVDLPQDVQDATRHLDAPGCRADVAHDHPRRQVRHLGLDEGHLPTAVSQLAVDWRPIARPFHGEVKPADFWKAVPEQ